ncbi:MAG: hypothetical protein VKL42_17970 [Snowella sp.]|nr:hypothetical protein [Snowella sp.]
MTKIWAEVSKIWVEEDVIGYFLTIPSRFPAEQQRYCLLAAAFFNEFRQRNPVSLFTSQDVLLQAYRNMPSSSRGDFRNYIASELCITITAFNDDDDQRVLELAHKFDTFKSLETSILKNIVCLLKQDCDAVLTSNSEYKTIYRKFLPDDSVSIFSLTDLRYEWIEQYLRADPPNLALANQMTAEVMLIPQ